MKNYTLIPPDIIAVIPPLYSSENVLTAKKTVAVKLFCSAFIWYIMEGEFDSERDDFTMFGYVKNEADPYCSEWGYISLNELEALTFDAQIRSGRILGTAVERDLYFEPTVIGELVPDI